MIRKIISLLYLLCFSMVFSQKYDFESYGVVNEYSRGRVIFQKAQLSVENKKKGNYQLVVFSSYDNSIEMDAKVIYKSYHAERNQYLYEGTIRIGVNDYNCHIKTKIKMDEFTLGKGNGDNFTFQKEYEIKVFYNKFSKKNDDMIETISLYPIVIKK